MLRVFQTFRKFFKIFGFRGIYFDFLSFFGISLHILTFLQFQAKITRADISLT